MPLHPLPAARSLRAAWLILSVVLFSPAAHAEQLGRLEIDLKVSGTESVRGFGESREHAEGRFEEHYVLSVTLQSSGEPSSVNVKDPAFLEMMMRGFALQGGGDAEEDERFLDFYGYEGCEIRIHVVMERELRGEFADVQGMVPYSVRRSADYTGNEFERMMACVTSSLVYDFKDGTFYMDAVAMPEAMVRTVREVRGRPTETSEERMGVLGEIGTWVAEQLRVAPQVGKHGATLPLVQSRSPPMSVGEFAGQAQVELSWRFERL